MKINYPKMSDKKMITLQLLIYFALLMFMAFILPACTDQCEVQSTYTYYEPVYTTLDELRSSVEILPAEEIKQVGKIYFKGGFLFINEPNEGVHVIDNRDPSNPLNKSFIRIPGAFDLAVRGNILFSDSYIDLVAIDISNLDVAQEVGRIEGLFDNYNSYGYYAQADLGIVTGWKEISEVTVSESSCEVRKNDWGMNYESGILMSDVTTLNNASALSPANPGMGGSMARFALSNNYLYALDLGDIIAINVADENNMQAGNPTYIDWGIETIFPNGNNLFIGAQNGMHIMDISSPSNPTLVSNYQHIRSCDPVIVDGDYAFVTLRSGTECNGFTNQLEVIDISNLSDPQLLYIYEMDNPHGLGKDGNALFICDGSSGLRIFDASDYSKISDNQIAHYDDIQAFDIIPFNNVAMMIGSDGLFQYDYSDLTDIKLLSKILIANE
jgi:hypothetical protein